MNKVEGDSASAINARVVSYIHRIYDLTGHSNTSGTRSSILYTNTRSSARQGITDSRLLSILIDLFDNLGTKCNRIVGHFINGSGVTS